MTILLTVLLIFALLCAVAHVEGKRRKREQRHIEIMTFPYEQAMRDDIFQQICGAFQAPSHLFQGQIGWVSVRDAETGEEMIHEPTEEALAAWRHKE